MNTTYFILAVLGFLSDNSNVLFGSVSKNHTNEIKRSLVKSLLASFGVTCLNKVPDDRQEEFLDLLISGLKDQIPEVKELVGGAQ